MKNAKFALVFFYGKTLKSEKQVRSRLWHHIKKDTEEKSPRFQGYLKSNFPTETSRLDSNVSTTHMFSIHPNVLPMNLGTKRIQNCSRLTFLRKSATSAKSHLPIFNQIYVEQLAFVSFTSGAIKLFNPATTTSVLALTASCSLAPASSVAICFLCRFKRISTVESKVVQICSW